MRFLLPLFAASLLVLACGAPTSPDTTQDAGAQSPADAGQDAGSAVDAGAPVDAGVATPAAPQLTQLMKMAGALHIFWTNTEADCTTVRIERKTDTTDWAERFSVPGTVNNKMDGTATANTVYTYRLRCERDGVFSAYSNELSKNPTL